MLPVWWQSASLLRQPRVMQRNKRQKAKEDAIELSRRVQNRDKSTSRADALKGFRSNTYADICKEYGVSASTLKRDRNKSSLALQGRPKNGGSPSKRRRRAQETIIADIHLQPLKESRYAEILLRDDNDHREEHGRARRESFTPKAARIAFKNDGFKRQLLEDTPQSRIDASADMKNHVTNAAVIMQSCA